MPTRLPGTSYGVSCPWYVVVDVTERLDKALGRDRGSCLFLMAAEHHVDVHKGRVGCFCFVTLALGYELRQSCSAAVWHCNTSTPCPQAPDTIWFHSDVSRFMFFIVSWMSTHISIATFHVRSHHCATSRYFNLSVSPHVIFISGPP